MSKLIKFPQIPASKQRLAEILVQLLEKKMSRRLAVSVVNNSTLSEIEERVKYFQDKTIVNYIEFGDKLEIKEDTKFELNLVPVTADFGSLVVNGKKRSTAWIKLRLEKIREIQNKLEHKILKPADLIANPGWAYCWMNYFRLVYDEGVIKHAEPLRKWGER